MKRNIVIIVLALALAVASYMLGWSNVSLRDHEAREAQGRVALSLAIYQEMERGDFERAKGHMAMVVLRQTRHSAYAFGVPTGTTFFVQKFATPQALASPIARTLV